MKFDMPVASNSSDNFVKLADKEKISGVLSGDFYTYRDHWTGARSEVCSGAGCAHCKAGLKAKARFRINILVKNGEAFTAKILNGGSTMYEQLRALNEDYPLESTVITIQRNGVGMDTSYNFLPAKDGAVTPKMKEALDKVSLLDLNHATGGDEKRPFGEKSENDIF